MCHATATEDMDALCCGSPLVITPEPYTREREFFIDNLLVRIHFIIVMIKWTGIAPWEFEFSFPGSLTSTFLNPTPSSPTEDMDALCCGSPLVHPTSTLQGYLAHKKPPPPRSLQ